MSAEHDRLVERFTYTPPPGREDLIPAYTILRDAAVTFADTIMDTIPDGPGMFLPALRIEAALVSAIDALIPPPMPTLPSQPPQPFPEVEPEPMP